MNRTQENITKYKELIPGLKEKLAAAVLVFVMSAAMLVTSTFAWVTLSYNPAVQNVHTAVAANGNLEIALATGEMESATAPGASKEGDSKLPTVERNITWGNLINLNDSSYGLKHLVLRPSLLNDANLIERPLYGPVYDKDGRVIDMNTNFGYSEYDILNSRFTATNKLGVRAITSMKYGTSGTQNLLNMKLNNVADANIATQTEYLNIAQAEANKKYMDALASMMTGYMVENFLVNSGAASFIGDADLLRSDVAAFAEMYQKVIKAFESHADDVANLLTFEAEILGKPDLKITKEEILSLPYDKTNKTAYKKLLEMGFETYSDNNSTVGVVKSMDSFLYDYNVLQSDLVRLNGLYNSMTGNIKWKNCPLAENGSRLIDDIINNLTNVGTCTITGGKHKNLPIKSVGATIALELKSAGVCETKITNGILYNFDTYTGGRIRNRDGQPLRLTVQAMGTQTIQSNVSTSATLNHFESERAYVAKVIGDKYGEPELIANDSYGFAVDFWVRTNAQGSFLTLQGNVLTKTETIDVKGKNANGEEVQVYTITVKYENGESTGSALDDLMVVTYDVYESTQMVDDGNGNQTEQECLRFLESHEVVTKESLGGQEIPDHLKKVEEIETVIDYEGENRIWNGEEHSLLTVSSTTQGSGSCYTFYAETPTDQQRSLNLLKSMKIAFVDDQGKLLTTAYMDTEQHYASSGKVIVPIVLSGESISIGEDDNGNLKYAITALDQNVPKRISAIVYLDGSNLTNEDVLAAADIQGQMNIQFGSSTALVPLNNEALYTSEFYAEVEEITPNAFDFDTLTNGAKMESNVKVRISGTQPNSITATFIRRINATQGSPEPEDFTLTDADGDGLWEGSYEFSYPGTYILRSIVVDGVERDLKIPEGEDFPSVLVKGFSITNVSYDMNEVVMSDIDHYSGNVSLQFASDNPNKMPQTVVGKFAREDGAEVNVNFAYNATTTTWNGVANFTSSGEYTMQYVVLDGQYVELPESQQRTINLTLGMKVNVQTSTPTTIFYGEDNAPTKLAMQVKILDNNNDIITGLGSATLTYKMTETEKLDAVLKYNSGRQWYEGEFNVEPGTWKFDNVIIKMGDSSTNMLTKVNTDSPVFQVIPPTPPSYVSNLVDKVQYRKSGQYASFVATLADSGSAVVYAKLENEKGEIVYVVGDMAETSINGQFDYEFVIEDTGYWTMKSLSVFGAFDQDQNYHPVPSEMNEDNYNAGIIFDASTSTFTEIQSAVLYQEDISVTYSYADSLYTANNSIILGKDKNGNLTRSFMQAANLPEEAIRVTVTDKANLISQGYFNVENVTLSYKYGSLTDSSGKSYGSYVSSDYDNGIKGTNVGTLSFAAKNNTLFALTNANGAVNFDHSAQYTADKLNYTITSDYDTKVSEITEIANAGAHPVVLYSKAPSVTIAAVTPTGNYSKDTNTSGSISDTKTTTERTETSKDSCGKETTTTYYTHKWTLNSKHQAASSGSFISADKLSATVYYKCFHSGQATYGGDKETTEATATNQIYHSFSDGQANVPGTPTVTLNLSGISGFTNATLNFSNNTHLYTKITTTDKVGEGTTEGWWDNIVGVIAPNKELETTDAANYSWTSEGNCMRYVGYSWSKDHGANKVSIAASKKTPAGTITATQLDVVYGGKTYNFTVEKVTISNPY